MSIEIYADSNRGVFIPQFFAESVRPECLSGVSADELAILKAGPDHDAYWEAWTRALDNAKLTDDAGRTWTLYQDGDLFMVSDDASESERAELFGFDA